MKKIIILTLLSLLFGPVTVFAQMAGGDVPGLVSFLSALVSNLLLLLISAAIIYFLWGVLQFVSSGGDEQKRVEGRHMMLNGVIAIFVMVSIWGLVAFLDNTFNLIDDQAENIPIQEVPIL